MTAIQVHQAGTAVVIENNTIGTRYPNEPAPREMYSLDEEWVQKFTVCRFCGGRVNDETLARAYWQLQQQVCSIECFCAEDLKRHACCEKAQRNYCVCAYSTTCPDHGVRHFGTHD